MRAVLTFAFLLVAAPPVHAASIPAAFRGDWASKPSQCRDPDGMGIMSIGPDSVSFHEAQTIDGTLNILRSTKTELVLTNRMRGEGRTWQNKFNLRLGANRQTLTWTGNGEYGGDNPEVLVRCPK